MKPGSSSESAEVDAPGLVEVGRAKSDNEVGKHGREVAFGMFGGGCKAHKRSRFWTTGLVYVAR